MADLMLLLMITFCIGVAFGFGVLHYYVLFQYDRQIKEIWTEIRGRKKKHYPLYAPRKKLP